MSAGDLIRKLRKQKSLTQRELAEAVSSVTGQTPPLTSASVSDWERGANRLTIDNARAVDKVLDANGAILDALGFSPGDGPTLADVQRRLDELLALLHGQGALLAAIAQSELGLTEQELATLLQSVGAPPPP